MGNLQGCQGLALLEPLSLRGWSAGVRPPPWHSRALAGGSHTLSHTGSSSPPSTQEPERSVLSLRRSLCWLTLFFPSLHLLWGEKKPTYHSHCCSVPKWCAALWPRGLQHARLPCPSRLLEFAPAHVHWIGDAEQPSHPLLPSSP